MQKSAFERHRGQVQNADIANMDVYAGQGAGYGGQASCNSTRTLNT